MTTEQQIWEEQQEEEEAQMIRKMILQNSGAPAAATDMGRDEEVSRSVLSGFRAKEEEIEKKKMEIRERVEAHLGRVEEETKRLTEIREELEALQDPTRKEVASLRKRIDTMNRELKLLGVNCQKKEREYKEAVEGFNEKNREKAHFVARLMEIGNESEKIRMKRLEELSKNIEP